jgi:hypothetical protein
MECIECRNPKVENRDLQLCATCNAATRKLEREAAKVKVIVPVKKITQKRAGQMVEYMKLKREYLALYPVCEVPECNIKAVDIHHQKGRENDMLLNSDFYMAVCRKHHVYYTENSREAIDQGISKSRTI